MWMMGYNDGGDPFSGRKLRTIVPRPAAAAVINPSCTLGRIHGSDLLSFNHHLAAMTEQNKRDFSPQQVVVSSRWNPTPEQLQTLEELYRRGTRTPSAEEIQHITAQLRRYGKIEGKNVFYWFQNHKARERQKRRRQLESTSSSTTTTSDDPATHHNNINNNNIVVAENTERKEEESGANGTGLEVEGTKNWPPSTNCSSTTLAEKTGASIQRTAAAAAAAAAAIPECGVADGWVHFDAEAEFQQRKSLEEANATWRMMQLSCCSSNSTTLLSSPTNLLINSSTTINSPITTTIPALPTPLPSRTVLDPASQQLLLIKSARDRHRHRHSNVFINNPYGDNFHQVELINPNSIINITHVNIPDQTLQLFPLRNTNTDDGNEDVADEKESEGSVLLEAMNASNSTSAISSSSTAPYKFFEFLPLKN